MKRVFAAIKIQPSENLIATMYQLKHALRNENIKWVEPHNIHITIKFFGETAESDIDRIIEALRNVAENHYRFMFKIRSAGIFGSSYNPKVIWLGIHEHAELLELCNAVLNSMEIIGWIKDRQNFIPHLTLGRIKQIQDKTKLKSLIDQYKDVDIMKVNTTEIYLYESVLKPSGPIYHTLETFYLK
jgi:2'-5' RNA ligase